MQTQFIHSKPELTMIDKPIIICPYEDCNRMIEFCKGQTQDGSISKDFFDWYLDEKPKLFVTSAMLFIDNTASKHERTAVSFDFTDSNSVLFSCYAYADNSVVCTWRFNRQGNLSMNVLNFEFDYLSLANFKKVRSVIGSYKKGGTPKEAADDIAEKVVNKTPYKKGFRRLTKDQIMSDTMRKGQKEIIKMYADALTYFVYALMYFVSKQSPEIIASKFLKSNLADVEKIKGLYKYTGYVDLTDNRTYRPVVKKNSHDPARDYTRHIEAWTVRGHYRRTKEKLIWIEPHIKGKGTIEKRIYGTQNESQVDLTAKVFEVEKTIAKPLDVDLTAPTGKGRAKKKTIAARIIEFIYLLFKWQKK